MEKMTRTYKKENAILRDHKESTLEKQQKKRQEHNPPLEENVGSETDILNKKINQRLKRKEALSKAMNKYHDPDIVG
jgi:hypothetical protein